MVYGRVVFLFFVLFIAFLIFIFSFIFIKRGLMPTTSILQGKGLSPFQPIL